MVPMRESFGVTTDVALNLFEQEYQIKLPAEYRAFLKEHNGGIADTKDIIIPGWGESLVNIFNGLNLTGTRGKNYGLAENIDLFNDRFPIKEALVIADDPGGNQFLIGIGPSRFGKIYFWDHETWDDEADDCLPELIEIANSFDEFIIKIK